MTEKNIEWVRLDILENFRFWNKYAKSNDYEAAGREVIAQAIALIESDYSNPRVAEMLAQSTEFIRKKAEAGRKGALARIANLNSKRTPKPKKPPTKDEVYEFAMANNLDEVDARNWFEANFIERPGCDKDGEVIKNWKGACINHCKAAKAKREK